MIHYIEKELHCPVLDTAVSMEIRYISVAGTGQSKKDVIEHCTCNQLETCTYVDNYGRCPVYLKFPLTING